MDPTTGPIVVVGSINMDLVCRTHALPRAGETILGSDFVTIPGGKGANQAVAAAKLSQGDVHMVGRVGDDDFGQRLLNGLTQHNVGTKHVTITEGVHSGVGIIFVDRAGENSIVVAPGANHRLTPADLDAAEAVIDGASVVLLQLEIPRATVARAIAMCRKRQIYTILDPAPAVAKLPRSLLGVDLITPNQIEAQMLLDAPVPPRSRRKLPDPKQIGIDLLARGSRAVVLKLGRRGCMLVDRGGRIRTSRGFKVPVVDTTAAGDAFAAALAVARQENMDWPRALRFANAAGAITCQSFGAQPALPSRAAVEKVLKELA
jgi:ribokinase